MSDVPAGVLAALARSGLGPLAAAEDLAGGVISRTRRLRCAQGSAVLKQHRAAPHDLYPGEAAALDALRGVPGLAVPAVLSVGADHLLIEDLGPQADWDGWTAPPDDPFWDAYGRGLAHLHGRLSGTFGWHHPTYWGLMRMPQERLADGWDFHARHRYLWFLDRPNILRKTTADDRRGVERVAARLRAIVPPQPPSLLHGDLWAGNRARHPDGRPALIDPFVHFGWPEFELHGCRMFGGFPERFFAAYLESHPLEPGWRARSEVYDILHLLGLLDQCDEPDTLPWLRRLLARFGG